MSLTSTIKVAKPVSAVPPRPAASGMGRYSFLFAYILALLPTYVLPYVSALSGLMNFVSGGEGTVLPGLHTGCLVLCVFVAYLRSEATGRRLTLLLAALAAVFDLVPMLSAIPLVPTVLHVLALAKGCQQAQPGSRPFVSTPLTRFWAPIYLVALCGISAYAVMNTHAPKADSNKAFGGLLRSKKGASGLTVATTSSTTGGNFNLPPTTPVSASAAMPPSDVVAVTPTSLALAASMPGAMVVASPMPTPVPAPAPPEMPTAPATAVPPPARVMTTMPVTQPVALPAPAAPTVTQIAPAAAPQTPLQVAPQPSAEQLRVQPQGEQDRAQASARIAALAHTAKLNALLASPETAKTARDYAERYLQYIGSDDAAKAAEVIQGNEDEAQKFASYVHERGGIKSTTFPAVTYKRAADPSTLGELVVPFKVTTAGRQGSFRIQGALRLTLDDSGTKLIAKGR